MRRRRPRTAHVGRAAQASARALVSGRGDDQCATSQTSTGGGFEGHAIGMRRAQGTSRAKRHHLAAAPHGPVDASQGPTRHPSAGVVEDLADIDVGPGRSRSGAYLVGAGKVPARAGADEDGCRASDRLEHWALPAQTTGARSCVRGSRDDEDQPGIEHSHADTRPVKRLRVTPVAWRPHVNRRRVAERDHGQERSDAPWPPALAVEPSVERRCRVAEPADVLLLRAASCSSWSIASM